MDRKNRTFKLGFKVDEDLKEIGNLVLLENNLIHLEIELDRNDKNFLRIIKESHQALYRAMIEALRGSANIDVTNGEMVLLERLDHYKSTFDYYVPKYFLAHKYDIIELVNPCLRLIKELVYESGNVMSMYIPADFKNLLERIQNKLPQYREKLYQTNASDLDSRFC